MSTPAVLTANPGARLITDFGEGLGMVYGGIELTLQRELARRIMRDLDVYPDLLERLRTIRYLEEFTAKQLATVDLVALSKAVTDAAAAGGLAAAQRELGMVPGLLPSRVFTPTAVDAVQLVQLDLLNRLEKVHYRLGRYAPDAYRDFTAQLVPETLIGGQTWQQTQARLTQRMLDEGIVAFVADNGTKWRPGSYAEMVTRTVTNRAWTEASVGRMQQAGINVVTPIGTRSVCPLCAPWQGKNLSTDGTLPGIVMMPHATEPNRWVSMVIHATLAQARAAGLQHPNCRDVMVGVFPGLDTGAPAMEPGQNRELVAAEARLRSLEVAKREAKRELAISLDPARERVKRARVRAIEADIRAHVDATGVVRRRYREQLPFADGGSLNPRG